MPGPESSCEISLCLIAKDEEAMLPGCLASVAGAVDEIVVVDTGSADRTRELAREAGARVFEQPWRGDFSAPRNEALRRATGKWILHLDADERLAPGSADPLRSAVERAPWDVGFLALHNASTIDADARQVISGALREGPPLLLPRLLRNAGGLAWRGVVHENVDAWLVGRRRSMVDAHIVHLGNVRSVRASRGKAERNLELLRKQCGLTPDDVIPLGYLAAELLRAGDLDEAWEVAEQGWRILGRQPRERSIHRLAAIRALLALRRGDAQAALDCAKRAEARHGPHPDWHYVRGCVLELRASRAGFRSADGRALAARAAECFRRATAKRGTLYTEAYVDGASGAGSLVRVGNMLLAVGSHEEARAVFDKVLQEEPNHREARLGQVESMLDGGRPGQALAALEPLLDGAADGWVLAAAATLALGDRSSADLFAARARQACAAGLLSMHRLERLQGIASRQPA